MVVSLVVLRREQWHSVSPKAQRAECLGHTHTHARIHRERESEHTRGNTQGMTWDPGALYATARIMALTLSKTEGAGGP